MTLDQSDFDKFFQSYLETILWAETDNSTPQGGEPLDDNYDTDDFSPEFLKDQEEDCRQFVSDNIKDLEDIDPSQAGNDFWLSRNGHGAGYFDRGYGEKGDRLQRSAKVWGSVNVVVVDDGKLYGS